MPSDRRGVGTSGDSEPAVAVQAEHATVADVVRLSLHAVGAVRELGEPPARRVPGCCARGRQGRQCSSRRRRAVRSSPNRSPRCRHPRSRRTRRCGKNSELRRPHGRRCARLLSRLRGPLRPRQGSLRTRRSAPPQGPAAPVEGGRWRPSCSARPRTAVPPGPVACQERRLRLRGRTLGPGRGTRRVAPIGVAGNGGIRATLRPSGIPTERPENAHARVDRPADDSGHSASAEDVGVEGTALPTRLRILMTRTSDVPSTCVAAPPTLFRCARIPEGGSPLPARLPARTHPPPPRRRRRPRRRPSSAAPDG